MMRVQTAWLCLCLLWLHIAIDPQLHDKNDYGYIFYTLRSYINIAYNLHARTDYSHIFYKMRSYVKIAYNHLWTFAIGNAFVGLWTLVFIMWRSSPPIILEDCDERLTTVRHQLDIKENAELRYLRTRRCLMEEKKMLLERDLAIIDSKIQNLELENSSKKENIQDQHHSLENTQDADMLTQSVSKKIEDTDRMKNIFLKKVFNVLMEKESQNLYRELCSLKHSIQIIKKYQQLQKASQSILQKGSTEIAGNDGSDTRLKDSAKGKNNHPEAAAPILQEEPTNMPYSMDHGSNNNNSKQSLSSDCIDFLEPQLSTISNQKDNDSSVKLANK